MERKRKSCNLIQTWWILKRQYKSGVQKVAAFYDWEAENSLSQDAIIRISSFFKKKKTKKFNTDINK
jgi:hypothetical protein